IAMGILITFGSYMKKEISIEKSTVQVEIFDTAIAVLAGLMIIPAVFAYSGGEKAAVNGGPSLMFVTMPKVFTSMAGGNLIGVLFFALVLFAALTSSIALTESVVFAAEERFKWSRPKATTVVGLLILGLGTLSCLGYGPFANFNVLGMQILDLFDFLTNSVMMPIAAFLTCLLVIRVIGIGKIVLEVEDNGMPFRRKKLFAFMIRWVCPVFVIIILIAAVAGAFGLIKI
ncbi:MAG: sodium-dependent transporter, partial [bacterium]